MDEAPLDPVRVQKIEEALRYRFLNRKWLAAALTHSSRRAVGATVDNQRLAFLGDAVFGLTAALQLFEQKGFATKGELTTKRTELVNNEALAAAAEKRGLGAQLLLGPSEKQKEKVEASILATALEALVGAVFLDAGFEHAARIAQRLYR